jgi:CTP synthase
MSSPAPAEEDGRAPTKYVLITGGVVSGLGKGVTASSIGVVLKACGLRVTCIKIGTRSAGFCEVFPSW